MWNIRLKDALINFQIEKKQVCMQFITHSTHNAHRANAQLKLECNNLLIKVNSY